MSKQINEVVIQYHQFQAMLINQDNEKIWYGLPHLHVLLLISLGENPLQIKELLGCEDIETAFGSYGHLYVNSNFEVAKKLNGLFSKEEPVDLK